MSYKSRARLMIEGQVSFSFMFIAIVISVVAQHRNIVWLQGTTVLVMIIAALFLFRVALQTKRCPDPITPAVRKMWRRSAVICTVVIVGGLFILVAAIANHRRGWMIFVIISIPLLIQLFWTMRKRKV
jgi:hypothetical protein